MNNLSNAQLILKYRDEIIKLIKEDLNPSPEKLSCMISKLNKFNLQELERTYNMFYRFGVNTILDIIQEREV